MPTQRLSAKTDLTCITLSREESLAVSGFERACDEHELLYEPRIGVYPFIYGLANGNGRVAVRLYGEDIHRGGNQSIKRTLGCIRTWRNMDLSKPQNSRDSYYSEMELVV
ncbi:hypothetical protein TNCV_4668981 [Trichonephila clavipes]|nr:hypothetical protein TNCV_4668981 [Trichonephila clavipes]